MKLTKRQYTAIRDQVLSDLMDDIERYQIPNFLENTYTDNFVSYLEDNYALEDDAFVYLIEAVSNILGITIDDAESFVIDNKLTERIFDGVDLNKIANDLLDQYMQ